MIIQPWKDGGRPAQSTGTTSVLPFSGVCVLQMYPAENSESFVDGHLRAFSFFGGVPRRIVYDNPAYAVHRKSKLTGRERDLSTSFGELRSRCLFEAAFANPASGNEKGSVERKVAVLRQNWLVPVPKASSFESLNGALLEKASSHRETRLPLFAEDAANFLARALSEWRNPADRTRPIVIRPPLCEYDGLLTGASR